MDSDEHPTATADAGKQPYLTADLPGTGGIIKRYDEDFVVEEIPLYPASGEGTHTYFTIEKRGLTTFAAIDQVARALRRNPRDVGYAGLKDAHGITRQTFSVEHVEPARIESLTLSRLRVLAVTKHLNKIKLGHLAGNRFTIKIRNTIAFPLKRAEAIVAVLGLRGVPNYFGPQRFGVRGDNALIGRAVLLDDFDEAVARMLGRPGPADTGEVRKARTLFDAGDFEASAATWSHAFRDQARACRALAKTGGDARKAWRTVPHSLRKLYVSAFQSELFNGVLARRISTIDRLTDGDIAWKHRNGACFLVENAGLEQPRCDAFEISPTGPLFGRRMTEPHGVQQALEANVLAHSGLSRERVRARDGTRLDGARRPLRVPLLEPEVDAGRDDRGGYLLLGFTLAPGAYATGVAREICKNA